MMMILLTKLICMQKIYGNQSMNFLIKKREDTGIRHLDNSNSNAFIY